MWQQATDLLRAAEIAKKGGMLTAAFLGNDGVQARGLCDIELIIPSPSTARTQECHKILYHTLSDLIFLNGARLLALQA
jgi:D-sedoheptulose 7-phosphate isomerase